MSDNKKRYKLIACEVMFREICLCASRCRNIIDISFMAQGYHDVGDKKMREKLQAEIDSIDTKYYDAILLCYGLCNNGTRDLHANIPLVIPRAHDCITLLMGSKEIYKEYFFANPGTYFLSSGWLERDERDVEGGISQMLSLGKGMDYYTELYDEETAAYLVEILGDTTAHYKKMAFIDTGTGTGAEDKESAQERAIEKGWKFEVVYGDVSLIDGLLDGNWDTDKYLVVDPGKVIVPSNDERVVVTHEQEQG